MIGAVSFLVLVSGPIEAAPPELGYGSRVTVGGARPGIEGRPAAIHVWIVKPSGEELSEVCGTIPVGGYPPPNPWQYPLPDSCYLDVELDELGLWSLGVTAHYLHESPDLGGSFYWAVDELAAVVSELPIFSDGFETGDTTRWSSTVSGN